MIDKSKMTVDELFEAWFLTKEKSISPATYNRYHSDYTHYLSPGFSERKVNDITCEDWARFENDMVSVKGTNGKKLTLATVRKMLHAFHKVFEYGNTEFGLNDPTVGKILSGTKFVSEDYFTDEETEKMEAAAVRLNIAHICILICLHAGTLQSEICGLRWEDIDAANKVIKIRRSIRKDPNSPNKMSNSLCEVTPRNTRAIRDLRIPDDLMEQLTLIKRMHTDYEYVLTGKTKAMMPTTFANHHYVNFLDLAGVKNRKFAALRNTFAKKSIENCMDCETLSRLLGDPNDEYTRKMYYDKETNN